MSKDFGRPPLAAENQDLVERRLKELQDAAWRSGNAPHRMAGQPDSG